MLYILKSDTPELEYQIFGVYENFDKLLQAANNVFQGDEWLANRLQIEYKFSGLVNKHYYIIMFEAEKHKQF